MDSKNTISPKMFIFGIQHTFVMFGSTVLVPLITGLDVGISLFVAGLGTWIFHIVTKFNVPVFLGSSFAFIPGILAVAGNDPANNMPYAMGGIMIAGALYVLVGLIFKFIKPTVLQKILPAHVTGPMIILIGLMLAPVAISNSDGTNSPLITERIGSLGCWIVALSTFGLGIVVKILFPKLKLNMLSNLPVLLALVGGYIFSLILGIVDVSKIIDAAWFGIPKFTSPKFSVEASTIIVPIALATMVEHFGDIIAIGHVVKKDFLKDPGIHRTLLGDGLATTVAAFLGGPANTTYAENTGAIALTGVSNPVVMRIAATTAIILALVPKFTAIINSIPAPVIGGISILLFGMIASIGIRNMVDDRINFDNPKILIISSAMMVLGLGGAVFNFGPIKLSGIGLAAITGITLNLILRPKDSSKADS